MKAHKISGKITASIFNLPRVVGCVKRENGIVYELSEYSKDDELYEVLDATYEFAYYATPGRWLVFDEDNHLWYVLTEEEYRKLNK